MFCLCSLRKVDYVFPKQSNTLTQWHDIEIFQSVDWIFEDAIAVLVLRSQSFFVCMKMRVDEPQRDRKKQCWAGNKMLMSHAKLVVRFTDIFTRFWLTSVRNNCRFSRFSFSLVSFIFDFTLFRSSFHLIPCQWCWHHTQLSIEHFSHRNKETDFASQRAGDKRHRISSKTI